MDDKILRQMIREEIKAIMESTRVRNPKTRKHISLKTALEYDEHHPAHKAAKVIADKKRANKKKEQEEIPEPNIF